MTGLLAPLKNKSISCASVGIIAYAMVDANGNPFTKVDKTVFGNTSSGWVAGYSASTSGGITASWNIPTLTGYGTGTPLCTASWPNN